jgi:hypothetical protein|nr:MAG TPA: hypothetical protein [Caudoviricetes sp.]
MEINNQNNSEQINDFLTTSLSNIYGSITFIDINFDFEYNNINNWLTKILEAYIDKYNNKLKTLLVVEILQLPNYETMINQLFVNYLKLVLELGKKQKFNDVILIYTNFCDYFDFEYNKLYIVLHEKIQNLLKNQLIKKIGKSQYQKIEAKYSKSEIKQFTLFDL